MRVKGLSCLCGTEVECEALDLRDWGSIPGRGMSFLSLIMMGEDERVIEEERKGDDEEEDIILEMMAKTMGRRRMRRNLYTPPRRREVEMRRLQTALLSLQKCRDVLVLPKKRPRG